MGRLNGLRDHEPEHGDQRDERVSLDMPGVSKERLNIQTDKNALTIEGDVQIAMPEGMEALHAEVQATLDGVLTVRIPKRAELQPRRIEVRAA